MRSLNCRNTPESSPAALKRPRSKIDVADGRARGTVRASTRISRLLARQTNRNEKGLANRPPRFLRTFEIPECQPSEEPFAQRGVVSYTRRRTTSFSNCVVRPADGVLDIISH